MRSAASGILTCPGVCCGYVVVRGLSGLDSGVWRAGDKNGNGSERGTLPEVRSRVSPPRSPQPIKIACALVSSLTTRYVYRLSTTSPTVPTQLEHSPSHCHSSPLLTSSSTNYEGDRIHALPQLCTPSPAHPASGPRRRLAWPFKFLAVSSPDAIETSSPHRFGTRPRAHRSGDAGTPDRSTVRDYPRVPAA